MEIVKMGTTYWHKGQPLTEEQFAELQAEKAARRPADATDRCLLVRGGGSFCMKQLPKVGWWFDRVFGLVWQGRQLHYDNDGLFARVTVEQSSNWSGTRGSVEVWVSFVFDDECGQQVYHRRHRGLLPSELLPAWVRDPLSNLQRHGADVSKWEV